MLGVNRYQIGTLPIARYANCPYICLVRTPKTDNHKKESLIKKRFFFCNKLGSDQEIVGGMSRLIDPGENM